MVVKLWVLPRMCRWCRYAPILPTNIINTVLSMCSRNICVMRLLLAIVVVFFPTVPMQWDLIFIMFDSFFAVLFPSLRHFGFLSVSHLVFHFISELFPSISIRTLSTTNSHFVRLISHYTSSTWNKLVCSFRWNTLRALCTYLYLLCTPLCLHEMSVDHTGLCHKNANRINGMIIGVHKTYCTHASPNASLLLFLGLVCYVHYKCCK